MCVCATVSAALLAESDAMFPRHLVIDWTAAQTVMEEEEQKEEQQSCHVGG